MALIEAHGLTKKFRQAVKEPGLVGSLKHFFTLYEKGSRRQSGYVSRA